MAMTATQLGRLFERGAAATNLLLRDHGFLEGRPGAWQATELGKPFAHALGDSNDYGGYAARSWSWLAWSDDIVPVLRASMEAHPDGIVAATAPVRSVVATTSESQGRGRHRLLAVAAVGAVALTVPAAKRAWTTRVRPAASRARQRLSSADPSTQPDGVSNEAPAPPGQTPQPG